MGESSSGVEGFGVRGWGLGQVVGTVDTGSGVLGPGLVSSVRAWCPGSRIVTAWLVWLGLAGGGPVRLVVVAGR